MSDALVFPTADQVALAIVMAAGFVDERALSVPTPMGFAPRSRTICFAALRSAYPKAPRKGLARCLGYSAAEKKDVDDLAAQRLAQARGLKWWRDDWVDEIVGALIGDEIEGVA